MYCLGSSAILILFYLFSHSKSFHHHHHCHQPLNSTFPFIGNDLFYDFSDLIYREGLTHSQLALHPNKKLKIFLSAKDIVNFQKFLPGLNVSVILISRSNGDELIPYISSGQKKNMRLAYETILSNKNVFLWFASNLVVTHQKFIPMPLGTKWQWSTFLWHGEEMHKRRAYIILQKYAHNVAQNFFRTKENFVHFQMSLWTSDVSVYEPWRSTRRKAEKIFSERFTNQDIKSKLVYNYTCPQDTYSVHEFENYLVNLSTFKFTFSPPGRGPDVHRTWEALLMGSIPIIQSGPFDHLFDDLPVLFVETWEEVTPDLLNSLYPVFINQDYNFKKLFAPFWLSKISES